MITARSLAALVVATPRQDRARCRFELTPPALAEILRLKELVDAYAISPRLGQPDTLMGFPVEIVPGEEQGMDGVAFKVKREDAA